MTPSATRAEPPLDRTARRMNCLVRVDAARRAAQRRRLAAATQLEVAMRRAEHSGAR
jgi:hypothetical protein